MRFFGAKSACFQPFTSRPRLLRRGRQSSPPGARGEAERIAAILALGGIRRPLVLSIVKAFELTNE